MIIVIPATARDAENQWMREQIDPAGGEQSFSVPLSNDGGATVTHYWCGIHPATTEQANALREHFPLWMDELTPQEVLTMMGLTYVQTGGV